MALRTGLARSVGPSIWSLPAAATADHEGLVAFGADLDERTLVDAYQRGMFPWPHDGVPLPWFSPDPRGVVDVQREGAVVTRSLRQRLRQCSWSTTVDADFDAVVSACASRPGGEATWIDADMCRAYRRLHELGWAHSVEVWSDPVPSSGADPDPVGPRLVGGLYGVTVGGCWTGESMFHHEPDASKVAFVDLCERWREAGGTMVDVQLPTPHLARLGALAVSRQEFLTRLAAVVDDEVRVVVDRLPVGRLATPG